MTHGWRFGTILVSIIRATGSVVAVQTQVGKEFSNRAFQKGVSLLRTKSRDKVGVMRSRLTMPGRPGRVNSFHEFLADFYSLKAKKISAGRAALGDWLGHYRVSTGVGISA